MIFNQQIYMKMKMKVTSQFAAMTAENATIPVEINVTDGNVYLTAGEKIMIKHLINVDLKKLQNRVGKIKIGIDVERDNELRSIVQDLIALLDTKYKFD